MKILPTFFAVAAILLVHSSAFAIGGAGATCNPSTLNWGSCTLASVPFQASVPNTINIPAGHYATPYQATQANTEYFLQGDITADGVAIEVKASYVIINLNGHTITYGKTLAGEGVALATYNKNHLAVKNGTIIQSTDNIGKITSISIGSGGTGYTVGDVLTLTGGSINATATVTAVSSGVITGLSLTNPGKGYEVTWSAKYPTGYRGTITGGTGSGATINVTGTISEGDYAGKGKSPVGVFVGTTDYTGPYSFLANLYLKIYGRDMCGINMSGSDTTVEEVTVEDYYRIGTLKHRDFGEAAIRNRGDRSTIRNSTIIGARHRGIDAGKDSVAYGNNIATDTIATNGVALSALAGANVSFYSNTITARGEHPVGIMWYNDTTTPATANIYDNDINSKTTALGVEYAAGPYAADPTATIIGNGAVGFRTTWGGHGINFHDNRIVVDAAARYEGTYSPTGAVAYVAGRGRGLMIGVDAGDTAYFQNNTITVLGEVESSLAYGIVCDYSFSDKVFFLNNTVTANITNVALGDEYGECSGFPLVQGNTLVKSGNFSNYSTFSTQSGGLNNAEARIVGNTYQGGASVDSTNFNPSGYGAVNVYFGSIINGEQKYSYRLHDNNNTSSVLLREDFDPEFSIGYENPQIPRILNISPLAQ